MAGSFICVFQISPICPICSVKKAGPMSCHSLYTKRQRRLGIYCPDFLSGRLVPPPKAPMKVTFPAIFFLPRFWVRTDPLRSLPSVYVNSAFADNLYPIVLHWMCHLFALWYWLTHQASLHSPNKYPCLSTMPGVEGTEVKEKRQNACPCGTAILDLTMSDTEQTPF